MARGLWIGLVAAAYVAYLAASVGAQGVVDVPAYRERDVRLLDGREVRAWGTPARRHKIVEALAARHYHPPAVGLIPPGHHKAWPPDQPFDAAALDAIVNAKARDFHGNPYAANRESFLMERVRDPSALEALAAYGYRLRDPVWPAEAADLPPGERGKPLFAGGEPLDKAAIDVLLANGVRRVGIQGAGDPLALQAGTLLAVGLIFSALAAALGPAFFRPVRALIKERGRRLAEGLEQRRANRAAEEKLRDARGEGVVAIGRERQRRFDALRQQALADNDRILREARAREHEAMRQAEDALRQAIDGARAELRGDTEKLAREVVVMILKRPLTPARPFKPITPPEAPRIP